MSETRFVLLGFQVGSAPMTQHLGIRSFHATCAKVNVLPDGLCYYCVNKWSPRKGQLCHVFINERLVLKSVEVVGCYA